MEPDNHSEPVPEVDLQHADPAALMTSRDLPSLARKWARAVEQGRGIRLEAEDLDLLTTIGVTERIQAQSAEILKERVAWRIAQRGRTSMSAATIGSIGTVGKMEHFGQNILQSSGTTGSEDAPARLAHAQAISRPPSQR
jgi:hypothetical protein